MTYTVKQLANIAGVTPRTLRYYDEIGILKPSSIKANGYRVYEQKELLKLQQILFLRELTFSISDILMILTSPTFDPVLVLQDQRRLLELKIENNQRLIATIDTTIQMLKGGGTMTNNDLFTSFTDPQSQQYKEEAKKRWGNTLAYKQSVERTKKWTKDDYKRIVAEGKALTQELADSMDMPVSDPQVQSLIEKHYKSIQQFYDCSHEMYRALGKMYIDDSRFTETYEKVRPGLAAFMQAAISYYCNIHTAK